MTLRLLLAPVLAVAFAAITRIGVDPITVTRTVGQQVACNVTLMVSSVQASSTVDIGYDAALVIPRVPGGAVNGVTVSVVAPGTLRVAWAGVATPSDGTVIYGVVFDCVKPGTTRLTVKAVAATDVAGAALVCSGLSEDTLVIKAKPLLWRLLLQP